MSAKQKVVYQTDANRILIGTTVADESPLEPGVWILPGGCVELEPPAIPQGHLARYDSGAWLIEPIPAPAVERTVQEVPAESRPTQAKEVVQAYMDQTAQLSGYESLLSAISYAEESAVESFQLDGQRFRAWRSLVWAYVFAQHDLAIAHPEQALSLYELLMGLPELEGQHARIDLSEWPFLTDSQ